MKSLCSLATRTGGRYLGSDRRDDAGGLSGIVCMAAASCGWRWRQAMAIINDQQQHQTPSGRQHEQRRKRAE